MAKYKIDNIIIDSNKPNVFIESINNGKNLYIIKNNGKYVLLFISDTEKVVNIDTKINNGNIMTLEVTTI